MLHASERHDLLAAGIMKLSTALRGTPAEGPWVHPAKHPTRQNARPQCDLIQPLDADSCVHEQMQLEPWASRKPRSPVWSCRGRPGITSSSVSVYGVALQRAGFRHRLLHRSGQ